MGDFIVYHQTLSAQKLNAATTMLARQGSITPQRITQGDYCIYAYPKSLSPVCNVVQRHDGDFCVSSGTFFYKGLFGRAALEAVLTDFSPEHYRPQDYSGIFTLVLGKNNRLFLLSDPMGCSRIYHNAACGLWSSSLLATAVTSPRLTPNSQSIYEYAFQETVYGEETLFKEITTVDSRTQLELLPKRCVSHRKNLTFDFSPSSASYDEQLNKSAELLQQQLSQVTRAYDNKIRTALSGGYDSRLMLALLFQQGVTPSVYVYGGADSDDVRVAKSIANGSGFDLEHIDKGEFKPPLPERYGELVRDNFYALDGCPSASESIFDFGANIATRRQRIDNGYLVLNGGGGEIFRNFFYLPEGRFTIEDLIRTFYSRFTPALCRPPFSVTTYRQRLATKLMTALGVEQHSLSRTQLEFAYPAFRLRYWASRDSNTNTRLGSYMTPFISYNIIRQALTLPLRYKNHGRFQGDLINRINPQLASFPSDYGYSFSQGASVRHRLKNWLTYCRPPRLRQYSYAIKHCFATATVPVALSHRYTRELINSELPYLSRYFNIPVVKDPLLLSRLYNLEYLFTHLSAD